MISQKAKYAIKALACLAEAGFRSSLQIEEIATAASLPRKFLEHILLDLKRNGIVASRRGRAGGYALVKRPEEITIGQILRAIDGPIAPLPCISRTAYRRCEDCADEKTCVVRHLFADAYAAQLLLFDGTTLAEALRGRSAAMPAEPLAEAPLRNISVLLT
ncbi:MAG: Rrf2 family transcriptional regulator [Rhizobiales bacterium]|nr:Rrf2 family transcriptional regulator [Hyphomicrobiales bacterium]